jgi:putative membrane protein
MGKILAVGFLVMTMAVVSCSKKSKSSVTPLNQTDQQFVTNAGYNNVDEINAGYLASTNAADSAVRVFGHLMINDYGAAQSALILLADSLGFTVLSSPDQAHQTILTTLSGLTGVSFDTTYLRTQIDDDQAAISLYQSEQSGGQSPAVKAYVSQYLPVIEAHLSAADSLMKMEVGH